MVDLWRDCGIRETGTGQQVAQFHERYDDDDDDDDLQKTATDLYREIYESDSHPISLIHF